MSIVTILALNQEKIVAEFSDYFVVIADERKDSTQLGTSFKYIPIEVLPLAYRPLQNTIEAKFGGKAELRMAKVGPLKQFLLCLLLEKH